MAISENREDEFTEVQREWFFEETQPASEVLRHRIREIREGRFSQEELEEAMAFVGTPVDVSKIERGVRKVKVDELLAFAYVLDVPLSRLLSPLDGNQQLRAGGIGLERHEVGNWMVWGPWWSDLARRSTKIISLARGIATTSQAFEEEQDPKKRKPHIRELVTAHAGLRTGFRIRRGVLQRQADRKEMDRASTARE